MAHDDTIAMLQRVLALDPPAPALQFDHRWFSYGDLAAEIESTRSALRSLDVRQGSTVATVLPNEPCGLVAMLAVVLERACMVTISPYRPADDLRRAPACLAVVGPARSVPAGTSVGSWGLAVHRGEAGSPVPARTAVLMSTSGTTGEPKRVAISFETIDAVVGGVRSLAGGDAAALSLRDATTLVCFPYTNLSGILPQLIALVSGRRTALLERFEPRRVAELVAEHRMTSLALNPTSMQMLLDADIDPAALETVRYVRCGSAPLRPSLAAAFEERFDVGVLQSYGQTEVGGEVVGWSISDHRDFGRAKRGSVGRPHRGVEVAVVRNGDEPGSPLKPGAVGELWLRGARNVTGWHRTGDLAHIDDDGFVWIHGRADGLIICGGFNIVPAALERALEANPDVVEAAVVARADVRLGEVPVALVVLVPGATAGEEELIEHCRAHLEAFQLPRAVVVVEALPRTEIGKLHVPSLRQLAAAAPTVP